MQTQTKIATGVIAAVIVGGGLMMAMAAGMIGGDSAKTALLKSTPTPIVIVPRSTPTPSSKPVSYVRVTSPNGGEEFNIGKQITITWETTNKALNNCRIAWGQGPDFFASHDITPYPAGVPNTGSYTWTVQGDPTQTIQEKITVYCQGGDVILGTPQSLDTSDAAFKVTPASTPTPTACVPLPSCVSSTPACIPPPPPPGVVYCPVATPSSCANNAVNPPSCDQCGAGYILVNGKCVSNLTPTPTPPGPPTVAVTYPNDYFETRVGQPMRITWNSSNCDTVTLNWVHDVTQAYHPIATNISNQNSYDWTVQADPNNPNGNFFAKIDVLCSQGQYVFPNPVAIDQSNTRFYVRH